LISSVLPGFDAMGKLRPGDIIVALDGQPVPDSRDPQGLDAFSQRVQLKPAGSTLEMSVLREGRPIQVCIKLANAAALEAPLQDVISPEAPQPAQLQPLRR
jgi:S1-C subfamily serine protease